MRFARPVLNDALGLGLRRGFFVLMMLRGEHFAFRRGGCFYLPFALLTTRFFHAAAMSRSARFAPTTADFGHVSTILTDRDPPLATGCAGFVASKFVGAPTLVRSLSPLAGDLALTVRIHASKSALLRCRVRIVTRHDFTPSESDYW